MKCSNRKGLIIPTVICVLLCVIYYIVSFSYSMSMSASRTRYQNSLCGIKAYYMARSGMEHIILKINTMKQYCYDAILNLEKAPDKEKKYLYSVFIEDVLMPPHDNYKNEKLEYSIKKFNILSIDIENSTLTFEIEVNGKYCGYESSVKRIICLKR